MTILQLEIHTAPTCLNTGLYCRDLTQKLELPTGTHGQTDWFIANTQGGATRYLNRRLRNCANCGSRHGPPTGKGCSRLAEDFERRNDEMEEIADVRGESNDGGEWSGDEQTELMSPADTSPQGMVSLDPQTFRGSVPVETRAPFTGVASRGELTEQDDMAGGRQSSNLWAGLNPPPSWERAYQQQRPPMESDFERNMAERMIHMENIMGQMAGIQQSQFDRLIRLTDSLPAPPVSSTNQQAGRSEQPSDRQPASQSAGRQSASTSPVDQSASTGAQPFQLPRPTWAPPKQPAKKTVTDKESWSDCDDDDEDEDDSDGWKDFYGPTLWKREQEKKRKNPFDQRNYGKKGEKIDSYEKLMSITFKTIEQILSWGCDIRGIVRHALSMSEKASKDVYKTEAFVSYDASVRDRAGQVGPSAFRAVEQEDVMRFFCFDNTRKTTKQAGKQVGNKNDKICLRYNDGGCNTKNCAYAHKCVACEEWGHPRKDCRALKKKDNK